jgi:serum/glucocorticoid-regulated kinase 2
MGVDWWSLGTLLFEMMTGLPPFFSQNINIMYQKILNGELKFPAHISPDAQSLLSGFLTRDPEQRLGSRETGGEIKIKQHPWFAAYDWEKLDRKEIPPPWVPEVTDERDVTQIDATFTGEAPTDSPEEDSPINGKDANFKGFTFNPDSALDQ